MQNHFTMDLEIKAYVTLILSHVFLGLYFVWSFLPGSIIHYYGITYYPSKHWAVCLPSALAFVGFCFIFHNWFCERGMLPALDSFGAFTDPQGKQSYDIRMKQKMSIYDIPLESVNRRLYA